MAGYLGGSEDYYTHVKQFPVPSSNYTTNFEDLENIDEKNDDLNNKLFSGLDLRDNETPVRDQNGTYSTLLFTQKAETLVRSHDISKV